MTAQHQVAHVVDSQDQARADLYALLAALLLHAPSPSLLAALSSADALPATQQDHALRRTWESLVLSAGMMDAAGTAAEFDALFISVGTPQVSPNASRYLTGFLMEKPLAVLRDDLQALGLGRAAGSRELEDHLGALCETMRLLVAGTALLPAVGLAEQRTFFIKHISPWYLRCLDDMRSTIGVSFYRNVADFAQAFFETEFEAFGIDDEPGHDQEAANSSAEYQNA